MTKLTQFESTYMEEESKCAFRFKRKEQVHLVFFLDRPVRLVLESYNLCGIMYSYMPITYMN